MDEHPAVAAVRAKAVALFKKGDRYAVANDPYTFAKGKTKSSVLLAIVTPKGSIVLAIDMADWTDRQEMVAVMMLEFMGLKPAPTAAERAVAAVATLPAKKR